MLHVDIIKFFSPLFSEFLLKEKLKSENVVHLPHFHMYYCFGFCKNISLALFGTY